MCSSSDWPHPRGITRARGREARRQGASGRMKRLLIVGFASRRLPQHIILVPPGEIPNFEAFAEVKCSIMGMYYPLLWR